MFATRWIQLLWFVKFKELKFDFNFPLFNFFKTVNFDLMRQKDLIFIDLFILEIEERFVKIILFFLAKVVLLKETDSHQFWIKIMIKIISLLKNHFYLIKIFIVDH
jgi:hypothetical protein